MTEELARARRVTLDALVERFVHDQIRADEFERRVEAARAAGTVEALRGLLADLPGRVEATDPVEPSP